MKLRSNKNLLIALAFVIAIPLSLMAYSWSLDQIGFLGLIGFLPLELLILIACASLIAFAVRIKAIHEQ